MWPDNLSSFVLAGWWLLLIPPLVVPFNWAPIAGVCGVLLLVWMSRHLTIQLAGVTWIGLALLLVVMGLATAIAPDARLAAPRNWNLMLGLFAFLSIAAVPSDGLRRVVPLIFLGLGLGTIGLALITTEWKQDDLFRAAWLYDVFGTRPDGYVSSQGDVAGGVNANQTGGTMAVLAIALAGMTRVRAPALLRWLTGLTTVAALVVLLLTQSRGGIAAVGVGAFVLIAVSRRRGLWLAAIVALGLLVALATTWGWSVARESLFTSVSSGGLSVPLAGRIEVWQAAWRLIASSPVFGTGLNGFPILTMGQGLSTAYASGPLPHAHNFLLQTLTDIGLVGVLALVLIVVGSCRSAATAIGFRQDANSVQDSDRETLVTAAIASLAAFVAFGAVDALTMGSKPTLLVWLLLGVLAGIGSRSKRPSALPTDRPPRVLLLHVTAELGGSQRYLLHLARHLDHIGYETTLATGDHRLRLADPTGDVSLWLHRELAGTGVRCLVVPSMRREIAPFQDLRAIVDLWRLMRRERFDIVHSNGTKAGLLGRVAAWLAGAPHVIHTAHGFAFGETIDAPHRFLYFLAEWVGGRLCDRLITVCRADYDRAIAHRIASIDQLVLIHNGILVPPVTDRQEPGPGDVLVIGTVANCYPTKGLPHMVGSAALLRDRRAFQWVLVGDGEQRPLLERMVKAAGLEDRFRFAGSQRDVRPFLQSMDIFVLPSLKEGLPFALLEAMGHRLPVVASDVGGIGEIVTDGVSGILVSAADEQGLARAIVDLADNPAKRARLGDAARARVASEFGLDTMLERTGDAYRSLPEQPVRARGAHLGPLVLSALMLLLTAVTSLAVRADENMAPFSMIAASQTIEQPIVARNAEIFDNTDSRIGYAGQWVVEADGSAFGGHLSLTGDPGAFARLNATGTTITLIATGAPNRGGVRVVVDGQSFSFDLRRPSIAWQQRFTMRTAPGTHQVLIRPDPALPGPIDIDAIEVRESTAPLPPASIARFDDPGLRFEGTWRQVNRPAVEDRAMAETGVGGSAVEFAFQGQNFGIAFEPSPFGGLLDVAVDGVWVGTIDQSTLACLPCDLPQTARIGTSNGPHQVQMTFTGSKRPGSAPPRVNIVDVSIPASTNGLGPTSGPVIEPPSRSIGWFWLAAGLTLALVAIQVGAVGLFVWRLRSRIRIRESN